MGGVRTGRGLKGRRCLLQPFWTLAKEIYPGMHFVSQSYLSLRPRSTIPDR